MNVFLLSLVIFILVMLGIAVGVLKGRAPLKGSCGGNAVVKNCPTCTNDDFIKTEGDK